MSRIEEKTNYKCPICSEPLTLDIVGELYIVDHDYGFTNESPGADGCYCKNGHRIYIETESTDDEEEDEDPQDEFDRENDNINVSILNGRTIIENGGKLIGGQG